MQNTDKITLILGDCLEKMKDIPDGYIDLTVTSPPYDNLRTYNGNIDQWNEQKWKDIIAELFRVTKQGGVVVWVVGDATIKGSETGTSFKQALWAKDCGFNLHDTMIWKKQTFTDTGSLRVRYGNVFEYMFILSKGKPKTFNPIKDRINKQPGKKKYGTVRQIDGSLKPISSIGKKIGKYGQRFNVLNINTEVSNAKRCHPAQFPEKLAKDHIISWSNRGDIVLDPLMGSGTTGKMAKQLGRNFIGIELDETYFNIAKERIEYEHTETTVKGEVETEIAWSLTYPLECPVCIAKKGQKCFIQIDPRDNGRKSAVQNGQVHNERRKLFSEVWSIKNQAIKQERSRVVEEIKQVCKVHNYLPKEYEDKIIRFIENIGKSQPEI